MTPFTYTRAADASAAVSGMHAGGKFLGGGTNLVDLMRQRIEAPVALVDVTALPATIEENDDGSLFVGASVRNTELAAHQAVRTRFPVLSKAILAGASGQIRNMATVAGNIMQRTRCTYFYDLASRCNKRLPGDGCDALGGFTRNHAVLGTSAACVATHPSDMCVALACLDAVVHVLGPTGERTVALAEFHMLPGARPDLETVLAPGELIVGVTIPASEAAAHSTYRKVRDRSSYAFALVSVGAVLAVRDGVVSEARIALGGVAPKPWRAYDAERSLVGKPATGPSFDAAAALALQGAVPLRDNGFKITLARRTIASVLADLADGESA